MFYSGLWDRVGLPLSGAITTLFHGSYEHSPVGVHRDRFATFMFGLKGRKRMRFWDERPWTEPVSSVLDYERHLGTSFTAEVGPGDLLYWPANYYHVGESATGQPATSVNIGVPRADHHASYDLDDVLGGTDDGASSGVMFAPDGDFPRAWADCLANLRDHLRVDRAGELSLRHRTAGGFRPVPTGEAGPARRRRRTSRGRGDPDHRQAVRRERPRRPHRTARTGRRAASAARRPGRRRS